MNHINRSGLVLLGVMSVFLPFWLTIGKGMIFGVGGWVALVYMFTIAPLLFVVFWILFTLLAVRRDVRETKAIGSLDSLLLVGLYISIFLHGFYVVDGGDTEESINSVATKYFNVSTEISGQYSGFLLAGAFALVVACLVVFIYELVKKRAIELRI